MNLRPSDTPLTDWHAKAVKLADAQDWLCSICGRPILRKASFGSDWGLTIDHVRPRSLQKQKTEPWVFDRRGRPQFEPNTVAAHGRCNHAKGSRPPTGCELIWLVAVNARLGRS